MVLSIFFLLPACGRSTSEEREEEIYTEYPVPFGDPFVLYHDGVYYAYGTHADDGIEVFTSENLVHWYKESNLALHRDDSFGDHWFWAPEIYYIPEKDVFYMYYSAEEHICVATSSSPKGPFKQDVKEPMLADKAIDNSLFIDEDGKAYLSFVRFTNGNEIWVSELEDDLKTIKENTLKPVLQMSQEWEMVWPKVNEGSFIVKHKDLYYMTYSANSFESQFYGVGYATATTPMGPWTKYDENPILQNPEDLVGVGHSAMFRDADDDLNIVFHAHHSKWDIHPRGMYIAKVIFTSDKIPIMQIEGNVIHTKVLK